MKKIILLLAVLSFLFVGCTETGTGISEEQAKKIALSRVPGAATENIREFKKDIDNGKVEYEGEIVYNNTEYEFEIDALTGKIKNWETESIYN